MSLKTFGLLIFAALVALGAKDCLSAGGWPNIFVGIEGLGVALFLCICGFVHPRIRARSATFEKVLPDFSGAETEMPTDEYRRQIERAADSEPVVGALRH